MQPPIEHPEKKRLLRKAAAHRAELETEFEEITRRSEKILTHVLIIGGTIALTYLLVRQLAGSKPKKKLKTNENSTEQAEQQTTISPLTGILTHVGTVLTSQATVFLLSLAKEKLTSYLRQTSTAPSNEHS